MSDPNRISGIVSVTLLCPMIGFSNEVSWLGTLHFKLQSLNDFFRIGYLCISTIIKS